MSGQSLYDIYIYSTNVNNISYHVQIQMVDAVSAFPFTTLDSKLSPCE